MAQVSSGSFTTSSAEGRSLTFYWGVDSTNITDNYKIIAWKVYGSGSASGFIKAGNFKIVIDGETVYEKDQDYRIELWKDTVVASGTKKLYHNSTGNKSFSASVEAGIYTYARNCSGSGSWELPTIPRYGTSNQSLNSKTETTIKMNWSSDNTVDYLWYSKDNGSTWTGVDVTDGKSGTYNITGLSPNTSYNIKTRIRRKDSQLTTDSSALSVTTYKVPTNTLNSKTETSIKVNWSCDSTVDYIWYSKDNGSTWTGVDVTDGTSGSYTISSLSANTSYKIKTRCRRKATQTTYDSATLSVTTYDYPYCTETPNFILGNTVTLKFYNPLNRDFKFYIIGNGTQINVEYYCSSTSYTGLTSTETTVPLLYATIPKAKSGKYQVKVVYGNSTKTRNNGNTYSIKGTETPTFTTFTYKDTNTAATEVTGNNQVLVKGLSTLQVAISSANKMVGKNSATPKNYVMSIDTLSKTVNYSTSDITADLGTVTSSGTKRLNVRAYDYRDLSTLAYKDITIYDYAKPVINASIKRLNNFEAETTIKVNGTYSRLTINGTDKNTITSVQYRYREKNGTWGSWTNLTTTLTSGKFTCNDVILSLDNSKSFEFEIQAIDKLQTSTKEIIVNIGQAIFFISSNNKLCYINGLEIPHNEVAPFVGVNKHRKIDDDTYTGAFGVGYNGATVLEAQKDEVIKGRIEIRQDGTLYNDVTKRVFMEDTSSTNYISQITYDTSKFSLSDANLNEIRLIGGKVVLINVTFSVTGTLSNSNENYFSLPSAIRPKKNVLVDVANYLSGVKGFGYYQSSSGYIRGKMEKSTTNGELNVQGVYTII